MDTPLTDDGASFLSSVSKSTMCSLHCYGNETLPICFLKQPAHSYAGCTRLLACFHWLPGLISGSPPCYSHVLSRGPVFLLQTYAHPVVGYK
jgi:hypothetical protein